MSASGIPTTLSPGGTTKFARADGQWAVPPGNGVAVPAFVTFANLPGAPTEGDLAQISDSNTNSWGANIAGSSIYRVLARWNGTNWTVVGI
jgi:hypothetical protein